MEYPQSSQNPLKSTQIHSGDDIDISMFDAWQVLIQGRRGSKPVAGDRTGQIPEIGTEASQSVTSTGYSDDLDRADQEALLRQQAIYQARQGKYELALALFDWLIAANPQNASHYNNRGLVRFQCGAFLLALADYSQALELNPRLAKVYNNRANCYAALGRLDAAIADYETAIGLNPTNLRTYINQGITLRELGQYDQANQIFEIALQLHKVLGQTTPTTSLLLEGHIYAERGRTHHLSGDWNWATADYQRALNRLPIAESPANTSNQLRQRIQTWLTQLTAPLSA